MQAILLTCTISPALLFSTPTVSVEPTLVTMIDVYQEEIAFHCTGTIPERILVDREIVWLVNGAETSHGVGPIFDLMGVRSTSELRPLILKGGGMYRYTCRMTVAVDGDPIQQDEATALLHIIGEHFVTSKQYSWHV